MREFVESPSPWVRDQVRAIEEAGTTEAADIQGMRVVLFFVQGAKTGTWRKVPLMRVEHEGTYAAVASKGGAPDHPQWYYSMKANPDVEVQDGMQVMPAVARIATGEERAQWWERCVQAFPPYAEYLEKAGDREIPVFLVTPT